MHESCRSYEWVMSHMRMSHVAHMNESCRTYEWVMSHRGDGSGPKPGTNSIPIGTRFVPLRKKKIPFIKNDEFSTPKYPETRNSCSTKKVEIKYKTEQNLGPSSAERYLLYFNRVEHRLRRIRSAKSWLRFKHLILAFLLFFRFHPLVAHMHESCHIHEGVMSHIWMSHVAHMNKWHSPLF